MKSFEIPQGMRDILIEESSKRTMLQERLRYYMQSCGFCRIETSLFEYYELFSKGISPIDDESIVKTIDRDGRVVVLRPDMTIPTARVVVTKLKEQHKPLKLLYIGNVYRTDKKNRGVLREFCQIGAEIFGGKGKWPDIEMIGMAKECFTKASVKDYKIDIGHAGIVKGIFKELTIPEEKKSAIIALISEKNLVELEREVSRLDISDRHREMLCKLPCFFGSPEDIFKRIDELVINKIVEESVEYLYEIYEKSKDIGLTSKLIVDAGMTGSVKYYTGLIFKAYARGAGSVIISGGRYDDLLGALGFDCPAAGFAIDIDSMIKAEASEDIEKEREYKILVTYSDNKFIEALEYSEGCRKDGKVVNLINCSDISNPEQYCKHNGYDEIMSFN
jgi:ATP phosphoribosyltransferase regulatory subunit